MDFVLIEEIIDYLKKVHTSFQSKINFLIQDKSHAIYLIQGGIITSTCSALSLNRIGMVVPTAQLMRLVGEALDLILFFDELQNNARQINAWFKGHVVERTYDNQGTVTKDERAKQSGLLPEDIGMLDKLHKEMNDSLSKYAHPTISAVRANVKKRDNTFDHDHLATRSASISATDFSDLFIVPTINALLVTKNNFPLLSDEQVVKLNYYRKRIQQDIYLI